MLEEKPEGARRAAGSLTAVVAALVLLGLGVSASSSPDVAALQRARRIAAVTGGGLSDDAFAALVARMDPSAAALARRHDPAAFRQSASLIGGYLGLRPDLGLGSRFGDAARRVNAAIPSAGMLEPAAPFVLAAGLERKRAARCLADAVYYEAALESRAGQEAVAQVILNRVRDPNFPNSVCGVVFQGADLATGCQFSFTCDGSMARGHVDWAWKRAEDVAEAALAGHVAAAVGTATHYHADYVFPYWSPTLAKVGQIGAHIFYRWTGGAGEAAAFVQRYAGREPVIDEAKYAVRRATLAQVKANTVTVAGADGGKRVVTRLGGRRAPTPDDIARINASLERLETQLRSDADASGKGPTLGATPAPAPTHPKPAPPPATGQGLAIAGPSTAPVAASAAGSTGAHTP